MEDSDQNSIEILNFLGTRAYIVSQKKAQISKQRVKCMRYIIDPGSRQLSPDRKQAILDSGTSKSCTLGFCRERENWPRWCVQVLSPHVL